MRAVAGGIALTLLATRPSAAEPTASTPEPERRDHFELSARFETHAALFRRALLPGPEGSLVQTETAAPVHEYVSLRVQNLDTSWRKDSVDLELSAWSRVWPTSSELEPAVDGDVQIASLTYRHDRAYARFGRQQVVGGAARFARLDGLQLGAELGAGLSAEAYGGLTVLPRWDARAGYHHLGSEADSLLRDPEAFEQPERSGSWLAGGSLSYRSRTLSASGSFHEQRERGELARRNLGLDARGSIADGASLGASAILDTDAARLADLRLWTDVKPITPLSLSLEYLHTEPALWLSRQSVLSVFSTDRFDEVGSIAALRLLDSLSLEGQGFLALYDDHRPGARAEGTIRFLPDQRSIVRLSYVRVLAPGNGYHALRSSLSRRLLARTQGTLEAYAYLYDRPIVGYRASLVYAGTLRYEASAAWSLSWGASVARTPYAGLDAQSLLRAVYDFDYTERGVAR